MSLPHIHRESRAVAEKYDRQRESGLVPSVLNLMQTAQTIEWVLWRKKEEIDARLQRYDKIPVKIRDPASSESEYMRGMEACFTIAARVLGDFSDEGYLLRTEAGRIGCSLIDVYYQLPPSKRLLLTRAVLAEREKNSESIAKIRRVSFAGESDNITDQVKNLAKDEERQLRSNYVRPATREKKRNFSTSSGFLENSPNKKREYENNVS